LVAQGLRRQADEFIDIKALQSKIARDPGERPAREPRVAPQFLQRTATPRTKLGRNSTESRL
jgi:hypothetical protein